MKMRILSALSFLTCFPAMANELVFTINFDKRPPFTALAYIDDGGQSKTITIDQKDKKFLSPAYVITTDDKLVFKNSDDIDHNIYANSPANGVKFDVGIIEPQSETAIDGSKWPKNSFVRIGCKIHPKMKSYIANINSSNSKTLVFTNKKKRYITKLENITGEQKATLWMPKYELIQTTLSEGQSKTVDIVKNGKKRGTVTIEYRELPVIASN